MTKQEAKAVLAGLEEIIVTKGVEKLENLVDGYLAGNFIALGKNKCPIHHLAEAVKLAHQIRSLLGEPTGSSAPVGSAAKKQ